MIAKINQINEALAVWLTKAFGTMWICYAFGLRLVRVDDEILN